MWVKIYCLFYPFRENIHGISREIELHIRSINKTLLKVETFQFSVCSYVLVRVGTTQVIDAKR